MTIERKHKHEHSRCLEEPKDGDENEEDEEEGEEVVNEGEQEKIKRTIGSRKRGVIRGEG